MEGMSKHFFYRNVRARGELELFLLSAASSLLLVRLFLQLSGFPQLGGDGLHIAHMLWGGILMAAAIIICLSFLGIRVQRLGAIIGGAGFGIFIDELGKFITADNNYFYQPAIGLIYAVFIILYLVVNFVSRNRPLSSREYQLNALSQLKEAVVRDMDIREAAEVRRLLDKADQHDPLTQHLRRMLEGIKPVPVKPTRLGRYSVAIGRQYESFWRQRQSNTLVRTFFVGEVFLFVASVVWIIYRNLDNVFDLFAGRLPFSKELVIGQLLSSLVAAAFTIWGALLLKNSRLRAYEQFRRATLINIFLTQFFMFTRIEFAALPGFFFNLTLLGLISYAIRQERRLRTTA